MRNFYHTYGNTYQPNFGQPQHAYASNLFVYGPYLEGPSHQMIPPEWFQYYATANPYIYPSYVPNVAYLFPQYHPASGLVQRVND